jgi:hypothetical protein
MWLVLAWERQIKTAANFLKSAGLTLKYNFTPSLTSPKVVTFSERGFVVINCVFKFI